MKKIGTFFRLEAASGIVLFLAALLAIAWANSPWRGAYFALFEHTIFGFSARDAIEDGLMAVFFFSVGMEIKRELSTGALSTFAAAILPAIAALGGMLVPALIFAALNRGGAGAAGWAIPTATDIAFCIGVLALLGSRVPRALVVFLTALAIFDDLGGVLLIALFYGKGLQWIWLAASAGVAGCVLLCNRFGLARWFVYLPAGLALWFTLHHSGVHAAISGVLLGLLVPARPADRAPINGFIHALHGWVAFGVMPLFALSSTGVDLSGLSPAMLLTPVTVGGALGLILGKQIGIFAFTAAAVRLGLSPMPGNARWLQLYGVAVLGGLGFTVALFVAGLAFDGEPALLSGAKLGVIFGSLISGVGGYLILRLARRERTAETAPARVVWYGGAM
jgi:Na+:H+ antiporter, NhaA family